MAEFSLKSTSMTPAVAISRLSGAMTPADLDYLENEFGKLKDAGALGLILEISALEGVTSAGLGAIVEMSKTLQEKGGRLVVAADGGGFARLAAMLGLQDRLTLAKTLDQAKKEMSGIKGV
ncbi:MAG: STAS domain-containing protein [Planctomycetota bacterium]|jgi:anti-anti-sigma factor|nr:STAS domain-containing protein [Planctomycetota bacterium]